VSGSGAPGTILSDGPRPTITAGEGAVELLRWSFEGGAKTESGALGLAAGTRIG
jgi:hypothetical protein